MSSNKSKKNSVIQTFAVALILSFSCSVLVTTSVVLLKDRQLINQAIFKKSNVLKAAGIEASPSEINQIFEDKVILRYINLENGDYVKEPTISGKKFDSITAAKDPRFSQKISSKLDLAKIKRRSLISEVYFIKASTDSAFKYPVSEVILPVRGKGLWSTMKGFIALSTEDFSVKGLSFFSHAETPGLGGEIDNPKWQQLWKDKNLYDDNFDVALKVIKGVAMKTDPNYDYQIDGLSGATITSDGVTKMIKYWLGKQGYKEFLIKQKNLNWSL